jgi:hypothetical protein
MNGVGRVFFRQGKGMLQCVAFQPLENHRSNVEKLLRAWKEGSTGEDWTLDPQTKDWLMEAITHHDWGKLSTFRITEKGKELSYSFSGHRFRLHPSIKHEYARLIERSPTTSQQEKSQIPLIKSHTKIA